MRTYWRARSIAPDKAAALVATGATGAVASRQASRVRRALVVLAATLALAGGLSLTSPAVAGAYGPGPSNVWTQGYNTYDGGCADTGPVPCGNPSCDPGNCQQWPYGSEQEGGYFHGTWYYVGDRSTSFHAGVAQAITDASNEPYYSPSFQEEWSSGWSCSNVSLCIEGGHLGNSGSGEELCATTNLYGQPAYYATVTFNLDVSNWYTGTPGSQSGCSLVAIAHHELGHVLGLGHSSDRGSVMYWAPATGSYGGDEQAALKAIYLNNYQPRQAGGGDTCNSCESACQQAVSSMPNMPASALDLGGACGDTNQQLPTVTYPSVNPEQAVQKPLGVAESEVATAEAIVHK